MIDIDLTDAVTAAANAFHLDGWSCVAHEPLGLDECEQCAEVMPKSARIALEAALPHIRDQLARQIETLPSLSIPGYFATQPSDLIRQDTAARIVRGGEWL